MALCLTLELQVLCVVISYAVANIGKFCGKNDLKIIRFISLKCKRTFHFLKKYFFSFHYKIPELSNVCNYIITKMFLDIHLQGRN